MQRFILALVVLLALAHADTFNFKVVGSAGTNPPQASPWTVIFVVNSSLTSTELNLKVGTTYYFNGTGVNTNHVLYISTSDKGAGDGFATGNGLSNNDVGVNSASANPIITWTPQTPTTTPYYYQCARQHPQMGWKINVIADPNASSSTSSTTIVSSSVPFLTGTTRSSAVSFVPSLFFAALGFFALF
eukprot:TRINITY_DN1059_c0_g1_i1.p1 TRINITY_DN1059_c0_g1~~TRINITY_DN1059_c0_g1_i1.p1  ORF type:complete len:218 (+),score=43.75 TRINITY_DN1059_c0_g1_i1:92-655(+)